jgi:hypothetical protein
MHTVFHSQNLKGRKYLRNLGIYGRIILKESSDWILLSQDRVQWRTLVDTVINHQVPYKAEFFFLS